MPFTVEQLMGDRGKPLTIEQHEMVNQALDRMLEHDYSQLPVVDQNNYPCGLISTDSILRAVNCLGVSHAQLGVLPATRQVPIYRIDADLFEVLDGVRNASAVLIVDSRGCLIGIVTSYDTTDYFHRRAEDLMLVEDVELTLRDYVESGYLDTEGEVDPVRLSEAVQAITPSNRSALLGRFKQALRFYLLKSGESNSQLDAEILNQAFAQHLDTPVLPKPVDRLDLSDYIQLLRNIWDHYQPTFTLEWSAMERLLSAVRETRNAIAHFREVTPEQRERLRFCTDLLARCSPKLSINAAVTLPTLKMQSEIQVSQLDLEPTDVSEPAEVYEPLLEEEIEANESRYAPLALYLQRLPLQEDKVQSNFKQVEEIIQDSLPPSARQHRNWWANDSVSHPQSQQWLEAGWKVSSVNMGEQKVVFSRIGERQSDYIHFFNTINDRLKQQSSLRIEPKPVTGRHWQLLEVSQPGQTHPLTLTLSFARQHRLRVEFYIHLGNREKSKQVFEQLLQQQAAIEAVVGEALSWERLDLRSRIALYHEGAITDTPESLVALQAWAIDAVLRLYQGLIEPMTAVRGAIIENS